MKKFFALLLSAVLFTLTACAPQPDPEQTQPNDQQTEQTETNPVQNPQTTPGQTEVKSEQEQQPLTLTQDNIYEVVSPALQAYALAHSAIAFANPVSDSEGYRIFFNADGTVKETSEDPVYEKSSEFKTLKELENYFTTYITPEYYQERIGRWLIEENQLFEGPDGLYCEFLPHCYTAFSGPITLVKQEDGVYSIQVCIHSNGPVASAGILQGIIENDHFKIISSEPEYLHLEIPYEDIPGTEHFPVGLGHDR